jgi:pimeloyl-ACP methyl ester carboxylesterase
MTRIPALIASVLLLCVNASAEERFQPVAKDATVFSYKIHYLEAGRGEPVILLHGSGGEGARWMPQIEALSKEFRVIAPDHIGFGQSDKPMTTYHSGVFAGFIVGFMKTIGVQRATFIGQSLGAAVALDLAVHHPDKVHRLVLVDGGGFRSPNDPPRSPPDWHARQIANAGTLAETASTWRSSTMTTSSSPTSWWSTTSFYGCARATPPRVRNGLPSAGWAV